MNGGWKNAPGVLRIAKRNKKLGEKFLLQFQKCQVLKLSILANKSKLLYIFTGFWALIAPETKKLVEIGIVEMWSMYVQYVPVISAIATCTYYVYIYIYELWYMHVPLVHVPRYALGQYLPVKISFQIKRVMKIS